MRRSTALGIAVVLMLVGVSMSAPASADCQGGPVWPSLDRARGTTFVGAFEGATPDEDGFDTFHWSVEHVYAGPLNPGPLDGWGIGDGCHPTGYRAGTRYLVSSRFPGGGDAFDTVAYELLGDGRVRLASYPDQPRSTAPKVYRRADTLRKALRLLVPKRSGNETRPEPDSTSSFEPIARDRAKDDLFVLSIATDRTEVVADEPIEITTTLRYVGGVKNKRATVSGGGNLVAFGVEQLDGPVDNGPGWRLSCGFHEFGPDEMLDIPYAKSGGFDPDDPMADFWRNWFDDPVLRLPVGRYVITAYAHHGGRGPVCARAPWETLTASVAIEVVAAPGASPAVDASVTPVPSAPPAATGSRAGSEPSAPAEATGAPATPAAEETTERPRLHEPLVLPKGPRPVLATGRAPDATVSRRGVRLDLWVPRSAIRTGRWVPATMRVTNLSGRPIKHYGQVGCDTGNDQLRFDFAGLFDAGQAWSGEAARFKKLFLRGSGLVSSGMTTVRPVRTDCLGSVGTEETLESGRSFTVSKVAFARYPWASQPLPSGKAKITACYRFEFGRVSDDAPAADRHYDECVSAPVRIKGRNVDYPSPQALTDAMLSDPTFRTWVEDRYPNAMFHTSVDGPWRKRGYYSWASDEYVGGPAPEEPVRISSQAGGKNGDWVRDLVIDAWTAEVLETDVVSGIAEPPEGAYPTPSPSPTP